MPPEVLTEQHDLVDESPVGVDFDAIKRVIELDEEIGELSAKANQLKAERTRLEEMLVEQYAMNGLTSMNCDGRTLYRNVEKYANAKAECRDQIVEWARREGLADMIAVNPARFKSWCKERIQEDGNLPAEIADKVTFYERVSLRNRKA